MGEVVVFDLLSAFDEPGSPAIGDDLSTVSQPPGGSRLPERLLLAATLLCIVASGATAASTSMSLWIVGYVVAVLGGVTALGFYRQALGTREQRNHLLVTKLERRLLGTYAVALLAAAAVNAVRLAAYWSGR
jgi:hypothetical protein